MASKSDLLSLDDEKLSLIEELNIERKSLNKFEDEILSKFGLNQSFYESIGLDDQNGVYEKLKKMTDLMNNIVSLVSKDQYEYSNKQKQLNIDKNLNWLNLDEKTIVNTSKIDLKKTKNEDESDQSYNVLSKEDKIIFGKMPYEEDIDLIKCKRCSKVLLSKAFKRHNDYCKDLSPRSYWSNYVTNLLEKDNAPQNQQNELQQQSQQLDMLDSERMKQMKQKKRKLVLSPSNELANPNAKRSNKINVATEPNYHPASNITIENILKSFEFDTSPEHYRKVCQWLWSRRGNMRYLASHQYCYQFRLITKSLSNQRMSLTVPHNQGNEINPKNILERFSREPRKIHYDTEHETQPNIIPLNPTEYIMKMNQLRGQRGQAT